MLIKVKPSLLRPYLSRRDDFQSAGIDKLVRTLLIAFHGLQTITRRKSLTGISFRWSKIDGKIGSIASFMGSCDVTAASIIRLVCDLWVPFKFI